MYKKIYDYIVNIDITERENYFKHIDNFINDYQNNEMCDDITNFSYKKLGERLSSLLKENKKFEELEVMENFLWNKVYNDKSVCFICGKRKEDYESTYCDECWKKEEKRLGIKNKGDE